MRKSKQTHEQDYLYYFLLIHATMHTATQWLNEYMREEAKPVHTLCHGDFWSNNILFTYGEDPDNPSSLVIIDYQLIFVGSPCYGKIFCYILVLKLSQRDQERL